MLPIPCVKNPSALCGSATMGVAARRSIHGTLTQLSGLQKRQGVMGCQAAGTSWAPLREPMPIYGSLRRYIRIERPDLDAARPERRLPRQASPLPATTANQPTTTPWRSVVLSTPQPYAIGSDGQVHADLYARPAIISTTKSKTGAGHALAGIEQISPAPDQYRHRSPAQMIIPDNPRLRDDYLKWVLNTCTASRRTRKELYERRRQFFLYGTGGDEEIKYNRLRISHRFLVASSFFIRPIAPNSNYPRQPMPTMHK